MMNLNSVIRWGQGEKSIKLVIIINLHNNILIPLINVGAFYYLLGNMSPVFRSKIQNIQLLLLAKYSSVTTFGIDHLMKPIVEDIKKLESVK